MAEGIRIDYSDKGREIVESSVRKLAEMTRRRKEILASFLFVFFFVKLC